MQSSKYRKVVAYVAMFLLVMNAAACSNQQARMAQADKVVAEELVTAPGRILTWNARMQLEVDDVSSASDAVRREVEAQKGYVESATESEKFGTELAVRVPTDKLKELVHGFESLGKVTSRSISAQDVTDSYTDLEATIKNKTMLRDELRRLLARAQSVTDIVAVQRELTTVQSELDSLQGRFKGLTSDVQYAHLSVNLEKRVVLGPLGLVVKGLTWCVERLFYIE